jgi:hypothetical protein
MGDIVAPSEYKSVVVETLKVGSKSIKLTKYIGENSDTIYLGGHTKYCIDALIHKPESSFDKRGIDISDAFLSRLYYNESCSLEHDFRRGIDSTMILNLCISYIKKNYTHIRTVSFSDTSYRTCDNGSDVELAEMQYIRTGKTWYQTHFGAYMDSSDTRKLTACSERFQRNKQFMTWKELKSYIKGNLPFDEYLLKDMYESSTTWQDFFGNLSDKMGISDFCSFVAPWLHRFIESELKFYFSSARFYIPVDKIKTIDYKSETYQQADKRFTQKVRRNRRAKLITQ